MKAIVNTAVCGLYGQPTRQCTLEDEALLGMVVDILEEAAPGWVRIRTHYRYEGIVNTDDLVMGDDKAAAWEALPKKIILYKDACDVLSDPKVQGWHVRELVRGSIIAPTGEEEGSWVKIALPDGVTGWVPKGILGEYYAAPFTDDEETMRNALVEAAMRYMGTHYRWGGKSPRGIDCSGLVSTAYMLCGILIHRDAKLLEGFPLKAIEMKDMRKGDAIFFPGHEAMYIGGGRYLHSTARDGDNGLTINSLIPGEPDFRADLLEEITEIGSYFA